MTKPNVIVCAANLCGEAVIPGVRHHDVLMNYNIRRMDLSGNPWVQGFLDRHGRFHSRTEAWKIAEAAGQIKYRCGGDTKDGGTLYSENLY